MYQELTFRRILPTSPEADRELLFRLVHDTFVDAFGKNYTKADLDAYRAERLTPDAIAPELDEAGAAFYLMETDGQAQGYLKWVSPCRKHLETSTQLGDHVAMRPMYLERFYMRHDALGSGVAPIAMQMVIAAAKRLGCDMIYLTVWERNYRAQRFYQNFGFRSAASTIYPVGTSQDHEFIYTLLV